MWHKKQFGGAGLGDEIGYTFTTGVLPELKYLGTIRYYDLVDSEVTPTTVGKVFPDLKFIAIENEELITAMSIKSNRNWTLPKPVLQDTDAGICSGSGSAGIITKDEELHVTYLLKDSARGFTGVHCEDYATIGTTKDVADVLFRFPNMADDVTYSEFSYLEGVIADTGFNVDDILILLQKTEKGSRPDSACWFYFNANAYVGSNGCIPEELLTTVVVNDGYYEPAQVNEIRATLNDQTFSLQATNSYDLNNFITIPIRSATGKTFGDETFLFGNISTRIKSTTYKSIMNMTILPNRFIKSNNPTFNENIHKVAFTELDIYDGDGNVVAVGKFSEPLQRKLNSDVQIINAIIDF